MREQSLAFLLGGCLCLYAFADFRRSGFSWATLTFLYLGVFLPILFGHLALGNQGHHDRNVALILIVIAGSCVSLRYFSFAAAVILVSWLFGSWWSGQLLDVWWYLYYFFIFPGIGLIACYLQHKHLVSTYKYQCRVQLQDVDLRIAARELENERLRRIESEAQLAHQRERVQQVERVNAMGEIVASIAHEINQPLNGILMHCGVLSLDNLGPEQHDASLAQIERMASHSAAIVKNLQERILNEPTEGVVFEVSDVVHQAIELTKDLAHFHGVPVEAQLDPPLVRIQGPETQFTQVLVNLLRNAIQAVAGSPTDTTPVLLATEMVESGLQVSIRDTGPGVPADQLHSIFKPFHSSKHGGMGMGLAICRSIVERLGSSLAATTNPAGGLTVSFTIPKRFVL